MSRLLNLQLFCQQHADTDTQILASSFSFVIFSLYDYVKWEMTMPGTKYTDKQERKVDHIEESYRKKGVSAKEAEKRAWATVNKQDGGGKKPGGSGRKKSSGDK